MSKGKGLSSSKAFMSKEVKVNSRILMLVALAYAYSGVAAFLLTWVRMVLAVPAVFLIGFAIYSWYKSDKKTGCEKFFSIRWYALASFIVLALLYCVICGMGGFFFQSSDWVKHNMILSDLVARKWPVLYHNAIDDSMLTYYLGQYLLPALVGKAFGSFRAAEFAMLFYGWIGICIALLVLFQAVHADTPRKQFVAFLVFVFFGTVLILSKWLYGLTSVGASDLMDHYHWVSDSIWLQYRTLFTALRWTFAQTIVSWILCGLFVEHWKDTKVYVLLAAPLVLYATFPFLGLALLMLGVFIVRHFQEKDRISLWRDAFSLPNICAFFGAALIPAIYLAGNVLTEKPAGTGFSMLNYGDKTVLYFCFCAAFLCYSAVIFTHHKRNVLFYLINAQLLLFPLFTMGYYNDLCMNSSVPAIYLLMIFVTQTLFASSRKKMQHVIRTVVLIVLLVCGAFYPFLEMKIVVEAGPFWHGEPTSDYGVYGPRGQLAECTLETYTRRDLPYALDFVYNYATYDYEDSVFYQYFANR